MPGFLRDWLVTFEYKDADTLLSRGPVSEVVTADADHFAVTLARNIAHGKHRVGNPVDGIFALVDVAALPAIGEDMVVARASTGDFDPVVFEPPLVLPVTEFYNGKDAAEGFFVDHPDYEVTLFVLPRSADAWPAEGATA